jgi:quinol-cytochrome oxidoreductase complex cytochrome b subunit
MMNDLWWLKSLALVGAGLWLGLGLFRLWFGWGVRRLYAGPPWPDAPEERLLPVVLYRVGMATAWTTMGVVALCMLSLLGHTGEGPMLLSIASGWWIAVVIFAWNTVWQFEHIWDDLNARQE